MNSNKVAADDSVTNKQLIPDQSTKKSDETLANTQLENETKS